MTQRKPAHNNGRKIAEQLAPWFALQLAFVEGIRSLQAQYPGSKVDQQLPITSLVNRYTNFHRRFGYGAPTNDAHPGWQNYLHGLAQASDGAARLTHTVQHFAGCVAEVLPDQPRVGCFSFAPPDADGVVRLHFNVADVRHGVGPLHTSKVAARKAELSAIRRMIADQYPHSRAVRGTSWLYHIAAYRRLFPKAYVDSRRVNYHGRFNGSSAWGQFLDHRRRVKRVLAEEFLSRMPELNLDELWKAYPLPPMVVECPFDQFDV